MTQEIFKDVVGYEGLYQVSNLGNVKSLKFGKEKILKQGENTWGYPFVILRNNGNSQLKAIHRLVAEAFIPNPDNKPEVDHINTIRTDNRVENLRWCTREENMANPITRDNRSQLKNGKLSKPVLQYSLGGELLAEFPSANEVERKLGFNQGHISACCRGRCKKVCGFIWKYK